MKFIQMQKSYKMKILQINKYFFKKGGAETVFFNTIQLLERHGHTVIPFSLKNKKNEPSLYESYFVDYPELSESSLPKKIKNMVCSMWDEEMQVKPLRPFKSIELFVGAGGSDAVSNHSAVG